MPNGAAVFTIEENGEEQLVVVLEVRRTHLRGMDPDALARALQQAVVLQHELQVKSIVFIKPGQLPKTSSGKVQRQTCRKMYLDGAIEALARIDKTAGEPASRPVSTVPAGRRVKGRTGLRWWKTTWLDCSRRMRSCRAVRCSAMCR